MNPTKISILAIALALPPAVSVGTGCGTKASATGAGGAATTSSSSASTTSGATGTSGATTAGSTSGGGASTSGSTSSGGGGGAPADAQPPAPGPMNPGDGAGTTAFAIRKLYLGNTDRDGTLDPDNGWKHYGYDIDGYISTAASTNLCQPVQNAPKDLVYTDGDDGIDNSFGANVLPILLAIASDVSGQQNASIAAGKFTMLLGIGALGGGANYNPLSATLYSGADLGSAPKFDGTDLWPVAADASGAAIERSLPASYLVNNTWVSGPKTSLTLNLVFSGYPLTLTIGSAVITMNLDAAHQNTTNGTLSGVIATSDLVAQVKMLAGNFDPNLCPGPTLDSIIEQIEQASDIMADGTQDPTKSCDGISIGIGADGALVQIGPVAPYVAPTPSPCPTTNCTCACDTLLGAGGCGDLCDAAKNGSPGTPDFCNGAPASPECAACVAASCKIDAAQSADGTLCTP